MKIGLVKFLNCLPLKLALQAEHQIIEGTPAELNVLFAQGELDAGMVSVVEYLKNKDKYELGELCIAAQKEVGSVILFAKKPLAEIEKLALPKDSATSNMLVQLFVEAEEIIYHNYEKKVDDFLQDFDGVLFIGDNALLAKSQNAKHDLAKLWYEETMLPMVFAVMVGAKIEAKVEKDINRLTSLACKKSGVEKDVIRDYFENKLQFELGDDERKSIELLYNKIISRGWR